MRNNYKSYLVLTIFILLTFFCSFTQTVKAQENLATVPTLQQKLDTQIQKMIEVGHLRPAYFNANEKIPHAMGTIINTAYRDYWSNPAETIHTLLHALPLVSDSIKVPLRSYLIQEWNDYPPYLYSHSGWQGAKRETNDLPTVVTESYLQTHAKPGTYDASWPGYTFNPFNIYASWKYLQEFADTTDNTLTNDPSFVLDQLRNKVEPVPVDFINADTATDYVYGETHTMYKPHLLNMYIAGYYGYLGLQDLARETRSAQVEEWLMDAEQLRLQLLDIPRSELEGIEAGGFLYLVPELAEFLRNNAKNKVAALIQEQEQLMSYWFVADIDETTATHWIVEKPAGRIEGSTAPYYDYWSLFNAKALILKVGQAELEKYLDVPAVDRGDLYYIQNLVSTFEAGEDTPTVQGDLDGDSDVDIFDYNILVSEFGKSEVGNQADLDTDGDVDIFDYNLLVGNFGK